LKDLTQAKAMALEPARSVDDRSEARINKKLRLRLQCQERSQRKKRSLKTRAAFSRSGRRSLAAWGCVSFRSSHPRLSAAGQKALTENQRAARPRSRRQHPNTLACISACGESLRDTAHARALECGSRSQLIRKRNMQPKGRSSRPSLHYHRRRH